MVQRQGDRIKQFFGNFSEDLVFDKTKIACELNPNELDRCQCDQMARLFVQYSAICTNENMPNGKIFSKVGLNFGQLQNKPSKDCKIDFK